MGITPFKARVDISLQDTAQIARHAFSELASYTPEQLSVLVPTPGADGWGRVMEDAWAVFELNPPTKILVRVAGPISSSGMSYLDRTPWY